MRPIRNRSLRLQQSSLPRGDFIGIFGADDEQDLLRPFERAAEQHEARVVQAVHEVGMGAPIALLLQGTRLIPLRAPRAGYGKEL